MDKPKLTYYGDLKITDGKYTDKEGNEKTRYITIGKLYHSPHLSRMSIYLNPTAMSEGKWINAYPHEEYQKEEPEQSGYNTFREQGAKLQKDTVIEPTDDEISLADIPFN